jgi:alkaline phosphatase D|tara:strand:+ start:1998 stop:3302 length:1305 start_codon:yes stop_codon:yes gene_type:complete
MLGFKKRRRQYILRITICACLLLVVQSSLLFAARPYVILVSFDGFRYDYPEAVDTPNLDRLAREGVRAKSLKPIFPSKTFPNHYAIATGMYAENHGIVSNIFWDPVWDEVYKLSDRTTVTDPKWYGGEPIWVTAEKQGVKTASYYWVGSEAPISGVSPAFFYYYDQSVPFDQRVNQVISWLQLPEDMRPHLITLYFHEPDWTGHEYGPAAPETGKAIQRADSTLGLLLAGIDTLSIADSINLIICSDHGMTQLSSVRMVYLADYLDLNNIDIIGGGEFSFVNLKQRSQRGILAALFRRHAIRKVARTLKAAHPNMTAYLGDEIPERWHYRHNRRIPEILVVADDGWSLITKPHATKEAERTHEETFWQRGSHGYDNAVEAMHAIFYAKGPAFKKGISIPTLSNIHIYPLIAEILILDPNPGIDGVIDSVRTMLK